MLLSLLALVLPLQASPCDGTANCTSTLVGDVTTAATAATSEQAPAPAPATRALTTEKTGSPKWHVLGQEFASLQALHDWLVAQSQDPTSTVPHEPVLRITLTGGTMHQREQTTWTYYNASQKIVIDGGGTTVSGLTKDQPAAGFFLSYRPYVGSGTSLAQPAPANLEIKDLTIRGYESGGVEISPMEGPGDDNRWDGGREAFLTGARIEDCRFEDLGSLHTPDSQTSWSGQRYGVGGILTRGVSNSWFVDNVFENLENGDVRGTSTGPRLIHAIYLRDQSSGNTVTGNSFDTVSGDPIRICNASNDNIFRKNTSTNAGIRVLVSEFYNPTENEADSTGTQIGGNDIGTLYGKKKTAKKYKESVSHGTRPDVS